jgi:hypothetical protein
MCVASYLHNLWVFPHLHSMFCADRDQLLQCEDISRITVDMNSQLSINGVQNQKWKTSKNLSVSNQPVNQSLEIDTERVKYIYASYFYMQSDVQHSECSCVLYCSCRVQHSDILVPVQWPASSGSVLPEHIQCCAHSWLHWRAVSSAYTTGDRKPLPAFYTRELE